jgi:hypothetical protein
MARLGEKECYHAANHSCNSSFNDWLINLRQDYRCHKVFFDPIWVFEKCKTAVSFLAARSITSASCDGAKRETGNWSVEAAGRSRNHCRVRVRRELTYYANVSSVRVKPQAEILPPRSFGHRNGGLIEPHTPWDSQRECRLRWLAIPPAISDTMSSKGAPLPQESREERSIQSDQRRLAPPDGPVGG